MLNSRNARNRIDSATAAKPTPRNQRSTMYRRRTRLCIAGSLQREGARLLILLLVAAHDAQRDEVQEKRNQEQGKAEREGGESLRAVEFLVAGQKLDDLHGDGCDARERVGGEVGREAR